jgi:four helix bundle protein
MTPEQMKQRTKRFALRVIRLVQALPRGPAARVLGQQLLRSGTSVGANYRSACRARSRAEFLARLGIVEEEADESAYWMELIVESGLMQRRRITPLMQEVEELLAMAVASIRTARGRSPGRRRPAIRRRKSEIRNPKSEMPRGQAGS